MELDDIGIYGFDCEVFSHDWLFVFIERKSREPTWFWNEDAVEMLEWLDAHDEEVLAGFNSKHYDQYILKSVILGLEPEEVKEVNDWIISGKTPWEHPLLAGEYVAIRQTDLMDDTQMGTSLKSIEGHLGMSIEESSVDFSIDRPLTRRERDEVLAYCIHDVEATLELLEIRRDYLETKLHLAELAGLDPYWALAQTDPKLGAAFMGASKHSPAPTDDERQVEFPACLEYRFVPDDVMGFFDAIHDESILDEELFSRKLTTSVGDCPVTYAWGGLHGGIDRCTEESSEGRAVLNYDVASLYPSIMIGYGYVSRAVPDPSRFAAVRDQRFEAKAQGDKRTAQALKSPLNKAFGAMLNQYNPMYDPKHGRSVCVAGQLSLTALMGAYAKVPGLRIIDANTDGVMISVPEEQRKEVAHINDWWQRMTGLVLEEDRIKRVVHKDVSNYALLKEDGSEKVKGSYLVRGIRPVGAWSINNNATIVAEAIKDQLLYGKPVEETILACDEPFKFQLIAKASGKYSRVYQELYSSEEGELVVEQVDRQRCNRVFATSDESLGRLYKVKRADGSVAKIESLPDHCLVCNEGMAPIEAIDKQWYVALARKRARDFEKKGNDMAAKAKKPSEPTGAADIAHAGIHRKLAMARKMFLDANPKKSGYNEHLDFEYFELSDIVPVQDEIFLELGLVEVFSYEEPVIIPVRSEGASSDVGVAEIKPAMGVSVVYNVDEPSEKLVFKHRWPDAKPIKSSKGKEVTNILQADGSTETYLRRYNKMKILDIVEADSIDASLGDKEAGSSEPPEAPEKVAKKKAKAKKPASSSEREKIAEGLTDVDGAADAQQIKQLKRAVKKLKEYSAEHPEVVEWSAEVAEATDRLTNCTREQAERYLIEAGKMREAFEAEAGE